MLTILFDRKMSLMTDELRDVMVIHHTFFPSKRWLSYDMVVQYMMRAPSNVLITGWEDLALNAGTLPNIVIDPYFFDKLLPMSSSQDWKRKRLVIHISGKRSIFLAKLRGSQKMVSLGPKIDFSPKFFLLLGFTP